MGVPRFGRGSRLGTQIHSIKHVIDSEGVLAAATNSDNIIQSTVVTRTDPFVPTQCEVGEILNGFFISIFVIGDTGAPVNGSINWYIAKRRSGQNLVTDFLDPGNTGTSDVRNQIFHEEKGLVGSGDGTAMAFKGVIVVPKNMRRIRQGDQFFIKIRANGTDSAQFCLKAIYKSFS